MLTNLVKNCQVSMTVFTVPPILPFFPCMYDSRLPQYVCLYMVSENPLWFLKLLLILKALKK